MHGSAESLRAGAGMADISPRPGVPLAGSVGLRAPASSIADPLYARALVFEQNGRKLCLLGLDVTFIDRVHTGKIRGAAESMGFDPTAVLVHATQTHSAPTIGDFMLEHDFQLPREFQWLRSCDPAYSEQACGRAIEAMRDANNSLRPARFGAACAMRDGMAFNRRGVKRNGKIGMPWPYSSISQPLGPVHFRYLEGPSDPEVGVMCVQDESLRVMGMLLHFTCHPVNEFFYRCAGGLPRVSADWPGAWGDAMRALSGKDIVPLVLNGCCGNINPWPPFEPDFVPDHRRMGRMLAEISDRIIGRTVFQSAAALDWKLKTVPIPTRKLDPDRLKSAHRMLAEQPVPLTLDDDPNRIDLNWLQSAMLVSLEAAQRREPAMPCEIQALRIGDTAIVGLPGEPFVEGQLRIKLASPAYPTFVAHACGHYAGYIPVREAFARGGHEVETSSWSRLAPEALDLMAEEASGLLRELFGGK